MLVLTDEDIWKGRRGFKQRIRAAPEKLSELLERAGTWQVRKPKRKRGILISKIEHAKLLIGRAHEVLTGTL